MQYIYSIELKKPSRTATMTVFKSEFSPFNHLENCLYIGKIQVPKEHRYSGVGSRLLNKVTDEADKEGITLVLYPRPDDDCKFNKAQLVRWYKRHDFRMTDTGFMVRTPKIT